MADVELIIAPAKVVAEVAKEMGASGFLDVLSETGKWFLEKSGEVVLVEVVKQHVHDLFARYREAKVAGDIPEDSQQGNHAGVQLQKALNALLEGRDEDRAEAVKQVFLGLAMNPPKNSLERVQQMEVLEIACSLSAWEIVLLNALERYRKEVFDPKIKSYYEGCNEQGKRELIELTVSQHPEQELSNWLSRFAEEDKGSVRILNDALTSLHDKKVLRHGLSGIMYYQSGALIDPDNPIYTRLGKKLVTHLYSATEGTDNAKQD